MILLFRNRLLLGRSLWKKSNDSSAPSLAEHAALLKVIDGLQVLILNDPSSVLIVAAVIEELQQSL